MFLLISRALPFLFIVFFALPSMAADWSFRDGVSSLSHDAVRDKITDKTAIQGFYKARNDRPYWIKSSNDLRKVGSATKLYERLRDSWQHGLNPDLYHVGSLEPLMRSQRASDFRLAELLLMQGYINYARDLSGIRIDPHDAKLRRGDWRDKMSAKDALSLLKSTRASRIYEVIEPQGETYEKLQSALIAEYRKEPSSLVSLETPDELIQPGQSHPIIPYIRKRLGARERRNDENFYEQNLVNKVVSFQYRRGLYADGIIGPKTIKELNKNREQIIQQLIVNLERLRWLPDERSDRYVMVNIPSATLWVIDEGRVSMEMDVIIGKPERPTLSFVTKITGIRLNPTWTVPVTIKREDIWPKLIEDPSYLIDKDIALYHKTEEGWMSLDPLSIDWGTITWEEVNAIRMVQTPGINNPLGQVRVLMPNQYNIYLHSTNDPRMFQNYDLAVSSGCVRMSEPLEFTNLILGALPDWSRDKMDEILGEGKMRNVNLKDPVPVYMLYQTAWLRDDGELILGHDIYGQDQAVWQALQKQNSAVIKL